MAFTVGAIAAKDGAGSSIGGGLIAADIAGGGVGPWFLFHGLIDGVAGVNSAGVNASHQLAIAVADAADVTQGAKADARSTATDTTAITIMSVLKQVSFSVQALVTNSTALWAVGTALTASVPVVQSGYKYETVAASSTITLGGSGATGDLLFGVLVIPSSVNAGAVNVVDNATSISVLAGGTASVSNLVPFLVPLNMTSVSGAWKVITGASVT